jgi:hypothetical protein
MVKKGQEQVSSLDSPRQGEDRNPNDPKIKHKGKQPRPQSESSSPSTGSKGART